ncbi:hypothetical protein E3U23_08750 [Erythrobacter litoralis]|uniref:hypothetical protein n=1 Tax=Erythrobacter litoralis TaxID=39960 RepID=UPI002434E869|nr:hypothetical protein [Erythrobacter litoralis]MDG6079280.1 hypothetical protein [Erythrobacter litoralis]
MSELRSILAQLEHYIADPRIAQGLLHDLTISFRQNSIEPDDVGDGIAERECTFFENLPNGANQGVFEKRTAGDDRLFGRKWVGCRLIDEIVRSTLFELNSIPIDRYVEIEPANIS